MNERDWVAVHEAGHAVVGEALGQRVLSAVLGEGAGIVLSAPAPEALPEVDAAVHLAGEIAGALAYGQDWPWVCDVNEWDAEYLRQIAEQTSGPEGDVLPYAAELVVRP